MNRRLSHVEDLTSHATGMLPVPQDQPFAVAPLAQPKACGGPTWQVNQQGTKSRSTVQIPVAPAVVALLLCLMGSVAAAADDSGTSSVPPDSPAAAAIAKADAAIDRIVEIPDEQRTFENTIAAVDDMYARLLLDMNMTTFMAHVSTDAKEQEIGRLARQHLSNWWVDVSKREDLYNAVMAYAKTKPQLEGERKRLLEHMLRDYRRSGMQLSPEKRAELKKVEKQLAELQIEFGRTIREDETRVLLTKEELSGVPEDRLEGIDRSHGLYLVKMDYPEIRPIMRYCDNERTRQKIWTANRRRGGRKNVRTLEKIMALRAQQAKLLGYAHPADYENEVRMTKKAETVMDFYKKLRPLVRKKAKLDFKELQDAKRKDTGNEKAILRPWDFGYYYNQLKKDKYAVDVQQVRQYLSLDNCLQGMFGITQHLYGLKYKEVTDAARAGKLEGFRIWHPDVRLFAVYDQASDELIGHFYIDLHPRPDKYSHAAQWGLRQHKLWSDGRVTRPLAALVCNFTKPTKDKPSLLTHGECTTLFHEFGHCLHTLLSEARFWQFAGTSVERDFVEAPSQMFEEWCYDADVLRSFAKHYDTGQPIPYKLVDGMVKSRYLASGMAAERQFTYGLFDMHLHLDPEGDIDTIKLAEQLWDQAGLNLELFDPVPGTYFHASFGHLMGYRAGYYGYQWSKVYAADMFERFEDLGMLSPKAGEQFRQKILARGGTIDGLDMVRDFLGREPRMTPYWKRLGLEVEEEKE